MEAVLTVCGLSQQNKDSITVTEGINNIQMLATIKPKDVAPLCTGLSKLPLNRGGSFIGLLKQKKIEALVWWANDCVAQGLPIDPNAWDQATLDATMDQMRVEAEEIDDDTASPIPTTFNVDDWTDDHFLFLQHLKQCKSSDTKRSLLYIVRDNLPLIPTMTREERLIQAAPHTGAYYKQDNTLVYQKLRTWLSKHKNPMEHIRPFEQAEDGRAAHAALKQYFDGPGEIAKQFAKAKVDYSNLHYKNEHSLPFVTFVSRFKKCMYIFEKAAQPRNIRTQVEELYGKINTDSSLLSTKIEVIKGNRNLRNNLDDTINLIAEGVAEAFPIPKRGTSRRYVSSTGRNQSGRGQRGGRSNRGGGRGRGGRGRGQGRANRGMMTDEDLAAKPGGKPGDTWNNIDISDLKKSYPPNVFNNFPAWLKVKISKAKSGTDFNRFINSTSTSNNDDISTVRSEIAQLRAIMQASTAYNENQNIPSAVSNENDNSTINTNASAGIRFGRNAYGGNNNHKRQKPNNDDE